MIYDDDAQSGTSLLITVSGSILNLVFVCFFNLKANRNGNFVLVLGGGGDKNL